jgi:hypothetical protein
MKNFILLIFLIFGGLASSAQQWAPIGAKWYYDERFAFSGNVDYVLYSSEKDTIFKGQNCRKISKSHDFYCLDRPPFELMFDRNDSVFFYDPKLDTFQLLYRFNANKNDSWILKIHEGQIGRNDTLNIFVDSTGSMVANNQTLKILYVTYSIRYENDSMKYHSRIVEKFGDLLFMFNFYPSSNLACDMNWPNGIRCYEDTAFGNYHFALSDSCSYTWTGINSNGKRNLILFPNPADETIQISGLNEPASFTINDMDGKIAESGVIKDSQVVTKYLSKGIYLLRIINSKGVILSNEKIVKK